MHIFSFIISAFHGFVKHCKEKPQFFQNDFPRKRVENAVHMMYNSINTEHSVKNEAVYFRCEERIPMKLGMVGLPNVGKEHTV